MRHQNRGSISLKQSLCFAQIEPLFYLNGASVSTLRKFHFHDLSSKLTINKVALDKK